MKRNWRSSIRRAGGGQATDSAVKIVGRIGDDDGEGITMSRAPAFAVSLCLAIVAAYSSPADDRLRLDEITADGTWDCKDPAGENVGTLVLAEKTYAFIKTDGRLGGYGTLFLIRENFDLPHFAVITGYLKDEVGSLGIGMRGPKGNNHDLSGEIYLTNILSTDGAGALDWECVRRLAPSA
jgi:hypothetical protein